MTAKTLKRKEALLEELMQIMNDHGISCMEIRTEPKKFSLKKTIREGYTILNNVVEKIKI